MTILLVIAGGLALAVLLLCLFAVLHSREITRESPPSTAPTTERGVPADRVDLWI